VKHWAAILEMVHEVAQRPRQQEAEAVETDVEAADASTPTRPRAAFGQNSIFRVASGSGRFAANLLFFGSGRSTSGRSSGRAASAHAEQDGERTPHGRSAAKVNVLTGSVENFFSPDFACDNEIVSPIMIHVAKQHKSRSRHDAQRSGALGRLLPEKCLTPDEEVAAHHRSEGVDWEKSKQEVGSLAHLRLQEQQVTRLVAERKADAQRTAMSKGRTGKPALPLVKAKQEKEHKSTWL
jgi:hypothetical protein